MISQERRGHLLANPDLFLITYFGHKIRRLEEFHLRLIQTATTRTRGLILYPAAHGKTTLVSSLLPIWAMCEDPNIRMALIAKNEPDAKGIMQGILAELQGNDELIRDFGPFHAEDKPWGLEKMSVAKRTLRAKEPTLAAMGAKSRAALGHRTDWTICDDVITDQNSSTPEQRGKVKEWFMQGPATMAEEQDDRLTVVGTLFDPEDLYHDLIELTNNDGSPTWHLQREDAIVEVCDCGHDNASHNWGRTCTECTCDGFSPDELKTTTLWVDRWPMARLMERRAEMGTLDFNKRYRNIAVDKSRMVFRQEYIDGGYIGKDHFPGCKDKSHRVGEFEHDWRRIGGFDPAVGITKSRKFCAHVTLAMGSCQDHERCVWVVDVERQQLTLPQQVDMILAKHREYGLTASMIEANSYQAGLYQAVKHKMDEMGEVWKVEPHYTSRVNKPNPELGVQSMGSWFEAGRVHIPWGDVHSQRRMRQLVDELVMYPGRYTDTVMAFWIAWLALQQSAPRFQSSNYLKKPLAWGSHRRTVRNPHYT